MGEEEELHFAPFGKKSSSLGRSGASALLWEEEALQLFFGKKRNSRSSLKEAELLLFFEKKWSSSSSLEGRGALALGRRGPSVLLWEEEEL